MARHVHVTSSSPRPESLGMPTGYNPSPGDAVSKIGVMNRTTDSYELMSTEVLCVWVVACLHCNDKMTRYPESIYLIRSTRKDGWERSTLSITLKMESMRWVQEDERRQDMKSRTGKPTDGGNTASTSRAFGRIGRTSVSWLVATGFLKREHAHSPQQTRFHQRINLTLLACECSVKGEWDQEFKELSRGIRDETQQKVSDRRVIFCWTCLMVGSSDLAGRLLRAQGFGLGNSDQSDLFLTYGRWEFEYLNPHLHMNTNVFPIVRSHPREFRSRRTVNGPFYELKHGVYLSLD